jgi:hypothetical protein
MLPRSINAQGTKLTWDVSDKPLIQLDDEYTNVCPKPGYIHPSNLGHNAVSFSWLPLDKVSEYIIYYRAENWSSSLDITVQGTFTRLTNLLPNTRYEIQLQAVCDGQYSDPYLFHIKTTPVPSCDAPEKVEIKHQGHRSAKIAWQKAEGAKKYKFQYRPETAIKYQTVETKDNYIELLKLEPNTLYEAKIYSVSGTGKLSPNSAFITFRTLPEFLLTMLITPTNLITTDLGLWTKLSWSTLESTSRFIVHISRDNGKTYTEYATVYGNTIVIPKEDFNRVKIKVQAIGLDENLSAYSEVIETGGRLPGKVESKSDNIASVTPAKISIYPNPVRDVINIKLEEDYNGIFEVAIQDATGKIIFETIITGSYGQAYFSLPDIAKGIYDMRVRTKNDIYRTKIMFD